MTAQIDSPSFNPPAAPLDFESAEQKRERKRRNQRLTRAMKNPHLALEQGWTEDPKFCTGLLDRCEHQAFALTPGGERLARRLVEIGDRAGEACFHHQAVGVLSHFYLARWDHYWAGKILYLHRDPILDCCPRCRSDYFRRQGDLFAEERRIADALVAFGRAEEERVGGFAADDYGRFCFPRSVALHFAGHRGRALADLDRTLRLTSLDAPQGYFMDSPAMAAIYVLGGDPCHDRAALESLERFEKRIVDRDGWTPVRVRLRWVKGLLHARLGHIRRARRCLKSAWSSLLTGPLAREAVASTLDLMQLACRHWELWGKNEELVKKVLGRCLERTDLHPDHQWQLEDIRDKVLPKFPYESFARIGAVRSSFIVTVPNRLDERIQPV